jgi:hypothetical protein
VGQSGRAPGILTQGGLSRTTVLSEPIEKRDDQFVFRRVGDWDAAGLANSFSDQIGVKPFRPEAGMVAVASAMWRTAVAARQVAIEGVERAHINLSEGAGPALQKAAEMRCRAEVFYGSQWRVSVRFESLSEAVNVQTTKT